MYALIWHLYQWGDAVEVLEPAELRAMVGELEACCELEKSLIVARTVGIHLGDCKIGGTLACHGR